MKWNEVKVETSSEAVEAVANLLMEAGASGVAIEDSLDAQFFQTDKFGEIVDRTAFTELTQGAYVMAYFPETTFLPELLPTIKEQIDKLPSFGLSIGKNEVTIEEVTEENWATAWKKYYHPVRVTRFLTIVPRWENYEPRLTDEKIISLDPGMAFGTGTHATTRLTLQALETILRGGETLLDVGTGSGVLSIAAKLLGARRVFAYDLDDVAVKAAQENIALNPVAKDVTVSANDGLIYINHSADGIVAKILADIIVRMVADAWRLLKPEGHFIISGIIEDKKDFVLETMYEQGFEIEQVLQETDWYAFILKKPATEENKV